MTDVLLLERETVPKGVKILTQFDPSLPDILGDESQLAQVFRNLIKNALQALAGIRGGVLTVATRMTTDFHILRSTGPVSPVPAGFVPETPSLTEKRTSRMPTVESQSSALPSFRSARLLAITFSDNGPGIAPEHLPHLFTPFFTTKNRGTGLGLAISRRIIIHHGGLIRVESIRGQGTTFHVHLPVALQ